MKAERVEVNKGFIISCLQNSHQQATENKLLRMIKTQGYTKARIWEDKENPGSYRYIRVD
ncbi:hypothetical protein GCM10011383_42420 [Hymenobacter cavernae]|uniref:Uncharacterized protein n=1 Tax=Hymenobacter cavernae TaxID=2044852 RepID=A0ABQ1UT23_9BACT|nr:hypothetical protein GCM10011383_42420 [Hymenobacter cavernae]